METNYKEWELRNKDYNIVRFIDYKSWRSKLKGEYNHITFNARSHELGLIMSDYLLDVDNITDVFYITDIKYDDYKYDKECIMIYKTKNDWYVEFKLRLNKMSSWLRLTYSKDINAFCALIN